MSGKQQAVGALGAALVAANFWTGSNRPLVSAVVGKGSTPADAAAAHTALKSVGLELLFVAVATLLAGLSDGLAGAMIAVIVALFILWAVTHFGPQSK